MNAKSPSPAGEGDFEIEIKSYESFLGVRG
jgi:hypothetical protein